MLSLTLITTSNAAGPQLNGGGSSFAKLEIDQWRAETARSPYNLDINYVAQGSSFGRQQYISGGLDFAATDVPFTEVEMDVLQQTYRKDFVYVPVSAGGLGFMFNLIDVNSQQVTSLNLTPRLACRIFTDPTMMWNDPELQSVNPSVAMPNQQIRAIVRSDGSGTSYVLSEFCIATAPDVWASFITLVQNDPNVDPVIKAGQPSSNWPPGLFGSALAADGVAQAVADRSGVYGITYNEAGFAKVRGFPNASMMNAAGEFVQPTESAVSIGLGYAAETAHGLFRVDYHGADPRAYFPAVYSYVIAQTTGFDPGKGEVLARFLCYAVTYGQRVELTSTLGYARPSEPLVDAARTSIAKIPGAPAWADCAIQPPAPEVPASTAPPTTTPTPAAEVPEAPWQWLLPASTAGVLLGSVAWLRRPRKSRAS